MEQSEEKKSKFAALRRFKKPGKNVFWLWICYQCVKGTLTLSFIWIPMFYMWFHH